MEETVHITVVFSIVVLASLTQSAVGDVETRITGGIPANPHEYPYMVVLALDTGLSEPNRCSGLIIDVNWVLTVAHCTQYANSIEITAGASDYCQSESSQQKRIIGTTEVYPHPNFEPQSKANDIALLFVPEAFVLNANVGVATLATTESSIFSLMKTCGWGQRSSQPDTHSCILECASNLQLLDDFTCQTVYVGSGQFPVEFECTDSSGPHGPCPGDSGGPLLRMSEPHGPVEALTTYMGSQDCESSYPSVYLTIHYYLDWIASVTQVPISTERSVN